MYWNSLTKKFYKKQIDSLVISVKPNADLAMLASIKKSLQKEQVEEIEAEEKPFLIFGLKPKSFLQYSIIGLVAFFLLFVILKRIISFSMLKYNSYLKSEAFAFTKVEKALKNNDYRLFLALIPSWSNRLKSGDNSFQNLVRENGSKELETVLKHIDEMTFRTHKAIEKHSYKLLLKELKGMRNNYFKQQTIKRNSTIKNGKWINPTASD